MSPQTPTGSMLWEWRIANGFLYSYLTRVPCASPLRSVPKNPVRFTSTYGWLRIHETLSRTLRSASGGGTTVCAVYVKLWRKNWRFLSARLCLGRHMTLKREINNLNTRVLQLLFLLNWSKSRSFRYKKSKKDIKKHYWSQRKIIFINNVILYIYLKYVLFI